MIERVAQALAGKAFVNAHYRAQARRALEVMREPTPEMEAAWLKTLDWMAKTALGDQQREAWRIENLTRWRLMIDAAAGSIGDASDAPSSADIQPKSGEAQS